MRCVFEAVTGCVLLRIITLTCSSNWINRSSLGKLENHTSNSLRLRVNVIIVFFFLCFHVQSRLVFLLAVLNISMDVYTRQGCDFLFFGFAFSISLSLSLQESWTLISFLKTKLPLFGSLFDVSCPRSHP